MLVAILRKRLRIDMDMYRILQILSLHLFEKVPVSQILTDSPTQINDLNDPNQLSLFNL